LENLKSKETKSKPLTVKAHQRRVRGKGDEKDG
jgi:hypothetical protein